jgi:hypothetical protein
MTTTTTMQALDEMTRLIAVFATACDDISPVSCLACCQLCRNHLLYLLDTIPLSDMAASTVIVARLRALPLVHESHACRSGGHPDANPPQIRWVLT